MNPQHSSKTAEHYTPSDIVEAAREVLGQIDLDPASCAEANEVVRATRYISTEENGLTAPWATPAVPAPAVFLNPPGGYVNPPKPGKKRGSGPTLPWAFWRKLMTARGLGCLEHAVVVCFSLEQLVAFQNDTLLGPLDFPICVPSKRVRYREPGGAIGSQPTHGSAIVYVHGRRNESQRFKCVFGRFGKVVGV